MIKRFAILGHPVAHSLSPEFHNRAFRRAGMKEHRYDFYDCPPENLSKAIDKIRAGEYQGYSVTIPHKESVMKFLDACSETAKQVGAVNTVIRRSDGTLFGDNTDVMGVEESFHEAGIGTITTALVLGSGGASKAVVYALRQLGARVEIASRKENSYELLNPDGDYQLIVNATPVGMSPDVDSSPLMDLRWFRSERIYMDCIYSPKMTKFLQLAKKAGAKIITGDRMFYFQALAQSKLFFEL